MLNIVEAMLTSGNCWWCLSLLLLCLDGITTQQLECPADSIRIISSDDVESWYVRSGTNFPVILSVSSLMDETKRYFIDDVVPNKGNITFKDTFILVGLTTAGFKLEPTKNDQFVSNFIFEYSDTLTSPYKAYHQTGLPDDANVTVHFVDPQLIVKRIQLTIHEAGQDMGDYYWRINLFGCLETEGIEVDIESPTMSTTTTTTTTTTTSTTSSSSTSTSSMSTETVTVTVTPMSCSISSQDQSMSTTSTSSPQAVDATYTCQAELSSTVVLIIILVAVLIGWTVTIIILCSNRNSGKYSVPLRKVRGSTINEVRNIPLYSMSDSKNAATDSNADNMMQNELYVESCNVVQNEAYTTTSPSPDSKITSETIFTSTNSSAPLVKSSTREYEPVYTELDDIDAMRCHTILSTDSSTALIIPDNGTYTIIGKDKSHTYDNVVTVDNVPTDSSKLDTVPIDDNSYSKLHHT